VMAALMLAGAKLGDILGRTRTFAIGLGIYGLGSLTTALSPNLSVLLIGWSLVEGIGAALVIPAIVSLIAGTYSGKQRALAFGVIGGVAGAAIAAGPLIGGWVTTELSWRYVFAGETVVVVAILLMRRSLHNPPRAEQRPVLDVVGVLLSAVGLGLVVYGILKSSSWGLIEPRGALTVGGTEITPFGFSAVPFVILAGVGFLFAFTHWEDHRERQGHDVLLDRALLAVPPLRAGLLTLMMQQLILLGTFFVLPVYLQVVLGLNAFETGKRLFPLSVTMFLAAMAGPRLAAGTAPKRVAQAGLLALAAASVLLVSTIDVELNDAGFAIAVSIFGIGAGLMLSQLGNVIMSSADPAKSNEAGGLQGTAQNLGASLGTALIGSVLIASLTTGFVTRVEANPAIPASVRTQVQQVAEKGVPIASVGDVEQAGLDNGVPAAEAQAVADDYGDAQLHALKRSILAVAFLALLGLVFTRKLPAKERSPTAATAPGS
jgi:MFS family permease